MTNPHDFKAARDAVSKWGSNWDSHNTVTEGDAVLLDYEHVIRFALQLAEKVCGEPSDGVTDAFAETVRIEEVAGFPMVVNFEEMYEAMRNQMIKDIEQGDGQ